MLGIDFVDAESRKASRGWILHHPPLLDCPHRDYISIRIAINVAVFHETAARDRR